MIRSTFVLAFSLTACGTSAVPAGGICTTASQCSTGLVCTAGKCVAQTSTACTSSLDCASGQVCASDVCVNNGSASSGSSSGSGSKPQEPVTLDVVGNGTVTGGATACTNVNACENLVIEGQSLTFSATADSGWTFAGWTLTSGTCSGTGTCTVTPASAVTVTATFTQNQPTVTVQVVGPGTVSGSTISCPSACSEQVAPGTALSLTAAAAANSYANFTGWTVSGGGTCSGTGTCTLTVDADTTVTATFVVPQYTLTIQVANGGQCGTIPPPDAIGTATPSPLPSGDAACTDTNGNDASCNYVYAAGTSVTIAGAGQSGAVLEGTSEAGGTDFGSFAGVTCTEANCMGQSDCECTLTLTEDTTIGLLFCN